MQEEIKFEVCVSYMVTCASTDQTSQQTSPALKEETFIDIGLHTVYILSFLMFLHEETLWDKYCLFPSSS